MTRLMRWWVPTVAAMAGIALTVSLGNWQTRRAGEKLQAQQAIDAAAASAPLDLAEALAAGGDAGIGRRVRATGRFLEAHTVYVDNRSHRGQAGFHVLTPFAAEGVERPVLVLRGWVPQDPSRRAELPAISAGGRVRIEALAQRDLDQVLELAAQRPPGPADRLWQNASVESVARWSGLALAPLLLRQLAESTESTDSHPTNVATPAAALYSPVRDWPSPGSGVDKHRAYAFQWYSMSALIAVLWLALAWRSTRPRV
ncbi:MAG: SURF1 family protein [Betaproteobacteria bacterium]